MVDSKTLFSSRKGRGLHRYRAYGVMRTVLDERCSPLIILHCYSPCEYWPWLNW